MELTPKQEKAVKIIIDRYRAGERYTVLSGGAGVGKTTTLSRALEVLELPEEQICYTSFTGKAVQRLKEIGIKYPAITLHKLMYDYITDEDENLIAVPKEDLGEIKIVVVDEVSICSFELMKQLFSYDIYVICCGDPFQLSPFGDDERNHHLLDSPHIFLDEVLRQAQESEIIRFSMRIREGKRLPKSHQGSEVHILDKKNITLDLLSRADQIICAMNGTKDKINFQLRNFLGKKGTIDVGEKLVCCKNYWDIEASSRESLTNGMMGTADNVRPSILNERKANINSFNYIKIDLKTDLGDFPNLGVDLSYLKTGTSSLTQKQLNKLKFLKKRYIKFYSIPLEFDYGYCITLWKAQGSQWHNVVGIEEKHPYDKLEHQKYLYTLLTRAIDKCVIFH